MKQLCFLMLSLVTCICGALDFYPGTSGTVIPEAGKEFSFDYHTGIDDYHLYGADVWAVRFDFSDEYPAMAISEFAVSKALLYLPQTGDSVRVELFTDVLGSPGSSLTWAKVPVNTNYLEIPFPTVVQNDSLWMIVTYATNFANRFVSASEGGGSHSYYWNTNAQNPYFQSLSNAGFNAELLFGLGGDFVLSALDLELLDFDLEGTLEPREIVGPTFRIYNHSTQTITDAVVGINVYSPDPEFAFFDSIDISEPIPPNSSYTFNSQSTGFSEHQFTLPPEPLQMKLRAALSSGQQSTDPQFNNVILIHRFSLDSPYPVYLTENFLRYTYSSQITNIQDQYTFPDIHTLNYFPIVNDTLGSVASQIRFNWYDFNSLPRTTFNGDQQINGFTPDYGDSYQQLCEQILLEKSFVSGSDCRFSYNELSDMLTANITLTNDYTLLYNSATEYNLISQSRLCVGLFKRVDVNDSERFVLTRWITHAASLDGSLNSGESYSAAYAIALNNLPLTELSQDYRLYYWLQLDNGGKILYSNWADFTSIVSNQDELMDIPEMQITSNPLRQGNTMRIKLSNGQNIIGLEVFNIRGQKILSYPVPTQDVLLTADQFSASGIYLLKATVTDGKGNKLCINKKINIIK